MNLIGTLMKLTACTRLKIGWATKGNDRIPTIHFRFSMLVSGSVVPCFSKTTAEAALMTGAGVAGATGSFPM